MRRLDRRVLALSVALIAAGAVLWLVLGKGATAKPPRSLYPGVIMIGMETWPGYMALVIARDKGNYREEGLAVEIKRYSALGKLSRDYVAGRKHRKIGDFVAAHKKDSSMRMFATDALIEERFIRGLDHESQTDAERP